jgi:AcrR family transcriptional regulator
MSPESTSDATGEPMPIDGRTARRNRNKQAVLDAVIALFSEQNLTPGVHEVAERSGVSLRSVYRYFTDVDDLVAAAIERHLDRARPLLDLTDPGVGPLADRIDRFARQRVAVFLQVRQVYRASVIRATDQDDVARILQQCRRRLAEQITVMFAPELERLDPREARMRGVMADCLAQFSTIDHLLRGHGLEPDEATEQLRQALARALG